MVDISGITNSAYTATTLSNLILATPKNTGIQAQVNGTLQKSFLFHIDGEQVLNLESDITDHYTENNEAVNDHIALRPETFTTTGFIGELNNVPPEGTGTVTEAVQKLVGISGYVPELTIGALQAYNVAQQAYQAANSVKKSFVSRWGDSPEQNEQQKAFNLFYGYWRDKTLFTVQTPWAKFDNMAIQSVVSTQDEDTQEITSFEVTFKKFRFVNEVTKVKIEQKSGRLNEQSQQGKGVDRGVVNPVPTDVNFSSLLA